MQPPEYQPPPPPQPPEAPQQPPVYAPPPPDLPAAYPVPPTPDAPPPYYGQPMPPPVAPRRSRGPLIAIVAIVLVVLVAAGGYFVAGTVYANNRIDSAGTTYNQVIDHENALTDLFNKLQSQLGTVSAKDATHANVAQAKTLYQQLVTQSQGSIPQIDTDTQLLTSADAKLKENQWLTVLSRSSLDSKSTKIADLKAALAEGRTISGDFIQYGNFAVALLASLDDLLTIGDDSTNHDLVGVTTAIGQMKTDVTNGIQLDHAPGLPTQVDLFMHDLQTMANDFAALFAAAAAGNQAGLTQAENALNKDSDNLAGYDTSSWDTQAQSFYGNMIDQYNSLIDKANKD